MSAPEISEACKNAIAAHGRGQSGFRSTTWFSSRSNAATVEVWNSGLVGMALRRTRHASLHAGGGAVRDAVTAGEQSVGSPGEAVQLMDPGRFPDRLGSRWRGLRP